MSLEPGQQFHVNAAEGYLELGMPLDANEELEQIDPFCRHLPEVLALRLDIYRALEKWELMETVAKRLTEYDADDPRRVIMWAFAARRARSIAEARGILLEAVERFPREAAIHFNLGCYAAQLGDLAEAKKHVGTAVSLDPSLRAVALEDPDLEPLWDALSAGWPT